MVAIAWMTPCRADAPRSLNDDGLGYLMRSEEGKTFDTYDARDYDRRDLSARGISPSRRSAPQPVKAAGITDPSRASYTLKHLTLGIILVVGSSLVGLWIWIGSIAEKVKENTRQVEDLAGGVHENTDRSKTQTSALENTPPQRRSPCRTSGKLPEIEFSEGALEKMVDGINTFRKRRSGVETGFALVGNIFGSGTTRKIIVKGLIDAGPDAECSAGHVDFDRDYQTREVEKLRLIDWDVCHIGDAHLHPGSMDHCSGGDYQTDRANVLASNSQEMVFVIATGAHAHRGGEAKDSLYVDGLKLDFFYMGVDSGFEYRKVMPKIARGEAALEIDDSLKRFYDSDPVRVVLDFDNLHRLPDYSYRFTICSMGDGHSSPCVEMTHRLLEYRLLIFFGDSAFEKPDVYVNIGEEIVQYDSDYVKDTPAAHLCFTQIALAAERDVPSLLTQNTMINGKKPADAKPASSITT
jgi:hypothetical protein